MSQQEYGELELLQIDGGVEIAITHGEEKTMAFLSPVQAVHVATTLMRFGGVRLIRRKAGGVITVEMER